MFVTFKGFFSGTNYLTCGFFLANLQLRFSAFYVKNALKRKRGPQYKDQWSNGTLMVNNIKYKMSGKI